MTKVLIEGGWGLSPPVFQLMSYVNSPFPLLLLWPHLSPNPKGVTLSINDWAHYSYNWIDYHHKMEV